MAAELVSAHARTLANALDSLTVTIEAALAAYGQSASSAELDRSAAKWRNTALRLLNADLARVQAALFQPGSPESIMTFVDVGSNELALGKKLDSFRLDFAGPVFEQKLNDAVSATVRSASELVQSVAGLQRS